MNPSYVGSRQIVNRILLARDRICVLSLTESLGFMDHTGVEVRTSNGGTRCGTVHMVPLWFSFHFRYTAFLLYTSLVTKVDQLMLFAGSDAQAPWFLLDPTNYLSKRTLNQSSKPPLLHCSLRSHCTTRPVPAALIQNRISQYIPQRILMSPNLLLRHQEYQAQNRTRT